MTKLEALSHETLNIEGRDGKIEVRVLGEGTMNPENIMVCLKSAQPGHGIFSVSPERLSI